MGQHGVAARTALAGILAAAGAAAGLTSPAMGQGKQPVVAGTGRMQPLPAFLGNVPVLRVSPHGSGHQSPQDPRDACNVVASLTDANFSGGQFIVEAGFAQGEIAAATYTIPASEFPIKINLMEVIVATSNASVSTTTQWSVLFWSGNPSTGNLIASYSSDDVILPYIRLGPGTTGTNLQFSIDPGDPDQIIIPDPGNHTFSIGFRIDHHNQQTGSGCGANDIPTCCNAFPTADVSGVSSLPGNWLDGINCGPFGCPANGGWANFQSLGSFCRPSGDWVMRATWSGVSCTPGVGGCCLPNGTCQVLSQSDCSAQSGTYRGDGTDCNGANCPQPNGACCFSNGNCLNFSQASCTTAGGTWLGAGTACSGGQCPTGACCLPNGTCQAGLTSPQCVGQGGTFRGVGTVCANQNCPQPQGACCLSNNGCLVLTQADCGQIPSSRWAGAGTACPGGCQNQCYANCDGSTIAPILNVNDFICFQQKYAAGDSYANCDGGTTPPVLNVNDFICFQTKYAQGCP